MEPITHLMTGACLARAGLNRRAAYTTLAMTIAAEFPDIDTLWSIDGPIAAFQHHRGITHTFVGLPFEAAFLVGVVWVIHRIRSKRAKPGETVTVAPVRWGLLWLFALIALLSHLLLDYTNNYGLRPFFPFNPRWYSGSIVFIFEPVIFVALLAALVLPALFGLINSEVGARRQPFRGRGLAVFALLTVLGVWTWRYTEQQKALALAATLDLSASQPPGTPAVPIMRIGVSPYPITPYRWHLVIESPNFYQTVEADTLRGTLSEATVADIFYRSPGTLATLAAKRSRLGEAYLDWSPVSSGHRDLANDRGLQSGFALDGYLSRLALYLRCSSDERARQAAAYRNRRAQQRPEDPQHGAERPDGEVTPTPGTNGHTGQIAVSRSA